MLNEQCVPVFVDWDDVNFRAAELENSPNPRVQENYRALKALNALETAYGVNWSHNPRRPIHITILSPQGEIMDYLNIDALISRNDVRRGLKAAIEKLGVEPGPTLIEKFCAADLKGGPQDLVLHLVSRFLVTPAEVKDYRPLFGQVGLTPENWLPAPDGLLENRSFTPVQEWVTLKPDQWRQLVFSPADRGARTWQVPQPLAGELLKHFAPPGEQYQLDAKRLQSHEFTAEVLEDEADLRRVRFTGHVSLIHPWWDIRDDDLVQAGLEGYLTYDPQADRITSLELVGVDTRYGHGKVRPALEIPMGVLFHGPAE